GGSRGVPSHFESGERTDLEKVGVAVEQKFDALARQELAGREVPGDVFLAAALSSFRECFFELRQRRQVKLAIFLEGLARRVDLGAENRIGLLAPVHGSRG